MFKSIKVIILTALLVIVAGGAGGGYFYLSSGLDAPLNVRSKQLLTVSKGQSVNQLCQSLESRGLVSDCLPLKLYSKLFDTYTGIKSGSYEVNAKEPLSQFLAKVVAGQVKQYSFTIIEGENLYQVLAKLNTAVALNNDLAGKDHQQVAQILALQSPSAEGWLYPETYRYPANSSASELLQRAVQKQQAVLEQEWQSRAENLPLTSAYQALILASIIEKESSVAGERDKIASVFHNRVKRKMRLQTDPTVIYGVWQSYKGDITRAHLRQKTPYNTYRINGFPPTPIANPSKASLQAALHPANTDFLYFVASGEGDHIFSKTLEQHNRALRNYLRKQRIKRLKDNHG